MSVQQPFPGFLKELITLAVTFDAINSVRSKPSIYFGEIHDLIENYANQIKQLRQVLYDKISKEFHSREKRYWTRGILKTSKIHD